MFVWIYPLAPSRQQNLKKGTSLNEQLNIVIRKGDYGGPVRSPDIRVQIPSWALQEAAVTFCASRPGWGVRGYVAGISEPLLAGNLGLRVLAAWGGCARAAGVPHGLPNRSPDAVTSRA
ncbi:unnamed protein product [Pelagomonas calceolata]|jgi:hypothetical protein|uniref:Uncharacterized protein n=1 Tax=Pelagomonas calceolata TaxID=35677 RepID=A0A8J2SJS6_9STRA|nr:unnamed protein product [Pelagomonas calceolata]